MFNNWRQLLLTGLVIFIAIIIHSIAGFGYAQVANGLLPLFLPARAASVIFTITAIVSNFRVLWSVREEFRRKDFLPPFIGLLFGLPLGVFVFQGLDPNQLRFAIGVTLLLSVGLIILLQQTKVVREWITRKAPKPGWKIGVLAGVLGGIFGGAVAIPGPPMIVYGTFMMGAGYWSGDRMKAVFTAFFGSLMSYRLVTLLLFTELVTLTLTLQAVLTFPFLFLGAWIGIKIFEYLPQKQFQWVVLGGLTVNAIILLTTAI